MWNHLYQVKQSSTRMVLLSSESSSPSHQSRICFNLFFWICFSPDSQFVWFQGQPCANSTSLLPWLGFFGRKSFCWILLFSFSCQVKMMIYILYDKSCCVFVCSGQKSLQHPTKFTTGSSRMNVKSNKVVKIYFFMFELFRHLPSDPSHRQIYSNSIKVPMLSNFVWF